MLLNRILKSIIHRGDLTVTDWNGKSVRYGDGNTPKSHIKFKSRAAALKLALDPDLFLGEIYMNGDMLLEQGTIHDFLVLAMQNTGVGGGQPVDIKRTHFIHDWLYRARIGLRRFHQRNPVGKAKDNVHHHYDLSGKMYDLFLDTDRQYSCAYFENDDVTLEQAQLAKKRHIAAKLNIKLGMKVLDIGCGWGGLGLYLAEICGADVTGVTLSEEQYKLANERADQRGLSNQARFLLTDYRLLENQFDRIVSVGMFEHVGVGHYGEFFAKVSSLLKTDGVALLHSINRSDGPGATSAWIKKYIFPGGYIPALSEVLPHMEKNGLYVADIEILRLHYAKTIRNWIDRFAANRNKATEIYDERFCRMWEFYLAGSECSFLYAGMNNFQIQFGKSQHVLPLTRSYIEAEEDRLRKLESKIPLLKMVRR
jgi:cyclopropane-fatty-acyl-phospholipid synthase